MSTLFGLSVTLKGFQPRISRTTETQILEMRGTNGNEEEISEILEMKGNNDQSV